MRFLSVLPLTLNSAGCWCEWKGVKRRPKCISGWESVFFHLEYITLSRCHIRIEWICIISCLKRSATIRSVVWRSYSTRCWFTPTSSVSLEPDWHTGPEPAGGWFQPGHSGHGDMCRFKGRVFDTPREYRRVQGHQETFLHQACELLHKQTKKLFQLPGRIFSQSSRKRQLAYCSPRGWKDDKVLSVRKCNLLELC